MSTTSKPKTIAECIDAYREAGNEMSVPREQLAAWAINNGLWEPTFQNQLKECSKQIGEALGQATSIDSKGHEYKRYIAARMPWGEDDGKERQKWLWDDALTCSRDHAHNATRHLHSSIAKDCKSLHNTVEAMNANNPNLAGSPIQLSWDFTDAVENDDT